jgi:hypothetical protein
MKQKVLQSNSKEVSKSIRPLAVLLLKWYDKNFEETNTKTYSQKIQLSVKGGEKA